MHQDPLEQILSCPSLPSLPAVAVQVLELTSDPSVKLEDLARTIQNDQGLAAKVLRTVNSSFFGLRKRCATIERALVMLGLNPVKNLVLGFSLVSAIRVPDVTAFDEVAYWRRSLYTAVGARSFAVASGLPEPEEAFLGGLMQDIGVMAMLLGLGPLYQEILGRTRGDHRLLVREELSALELQHPDIGAMLAQRWRLPEQLVIPVKYHERPTAAPPEHAKITRCVGLGNLVHDVLTDEEPAAALRRLYQKADAWLGLGTDAVDGVMTEVGKHAAEVARLFNLDTGGFRDAQAVIDNAQDRMRQMTRSGERTLPARLDELLAGKTETDPLTGLLSRESFEEAMRKALVTGSQQQEHVVLVELAVEGLPRAESARGGEAVDEALLGAAVELRRFFEPAGGICCRLTRSLFAVVLVGVTEGDARRLAMDARSAAESRPWAQDLGFVVGLASQAPDGADQVRVEQMVAVATRAVQAERAMTSRAAA